VSDERSAHGQLRPDVAVKDDWAFKAYRQFSVDAVNVSSHDLRYFSSLLAKPDASRRPDPASLLGRLVSANTISETAGVVGPRPFIVREVPSRRPGAKPTRVALIGLTETTPAPPAGFKFIDPVEAVRRTLPDARKQANVVIVLAKVSSKEAARIASEAPGIDVIIAGNAVTLEESFTMPVLVGQTLIVFTPFETRMLGELRFYAIAQGKFSTRQRFIALDEQSIAEDPEAKQLVDAATKAESDARTNSKKLLEDWLTTSRAPLSVGSATARIESPAYASSGACSQCHIAQYMKWSNSAHAHATDPLVARPSEFEAGCADCHGTGSKPASATSKFEIARSQNVQCEQCHGPGGDHVAKPSKGYGRIANVQATCASCHTSETSPGFDVQAGWAKIKH
jgi:hypothetical protein